MFKDITAKRRTKKTRGESKANMRSVFQIAPVAMGVVSNDIILDVNNCFCNISGYSRDELIGKNTSILHPTNEDYEYFTGESLRQFQKHGTSTLETRLECKDGSIIDVLLSSSPLNTTDLSAGMMFTALDITKRKLTEETLKESEKRYRRIIQTATDGFMLTDSQDGRLIDVNDAYCTMSGYTKEELLSMKIWDLVASETLEEMRLRGMKIMDQGGDWFKTQHRRKDGSILDVEVSVQFHPEERGRFFAFLRDITEQNRAEEKIRVLSSAIEQSIDGVAIANDVKGFTYVNEAFAEMHGYTPEEMIGMNICDVFDPESQNLVLEIIEQLDTQGSYRGETSRVRKDGTSFMAFQSTTGMKPPGSKVRWAITICRDITERKQAELEREKLQALLSTAVEITNLAPWEYDVASDLFTFNDHFYKVFRTTVEEVGGYTISSEEFAQRFFHPDELRAFKEKLRESGKAIDPDSGPFEHRIIFGDGTVGYISVKMFVVKDSLGRTVRTYGASQDITEQKRMEEELLRTQKLESVGLLAGGIAHDFNNILTTILGNTYIAKVEVDPEDEIFELLSEMETASSRAKALTKQLLTFAKGGAPVKKTSSIKDVITKSSIFVLRGSRSSCEFSIAEDLWSVDVDVGQINQVIHNIVLNANQAMPDGGRIRVTGENLTVEDKHGLPVKPGRYVRISIMDHGEGITKEDIAKVFDPFFTTKSDGSGLGLATAYSIIKKHDGHISVESELGESTTFRIYLPSSERRALKREEGEVIPGTGKILIMDDEAPLRRMVGRILERLGYDPEFAEDGAEALEMFKAAKETGKPYDAVILDLTVPGGMGGKDAVKKFLEIEPDVKTIVSSGYSDDPVLAEFKQYGFKGILPKPYEPRSMSKVLNEVLQGKLDLE